MGLAALAELMAGYPEAQAAAGKVGALNQITSVLRGYPESNAVQERACEALASFVGDHPGNQKLAWEADLPDSVIRISLERHWSSECTQAAGADALGKLVAGNAERP